MKKNDILYILIPTSILVFIWIGFNIQHNAKTSTIPEATSIQIAPIVPKFDEQTIESIKQREAIDPLLEIQKTIATPTPLLVTPTGTTPTVSLIVSPTISPTTSPTVTPTIKPTSTQ